MTTKKALPLLLLMFVLSTTACSTVLKSELMLADTHNTGWVPTKKGYKIQEEKVSFFLDYILLTDSQFLGSRCLMIGPPLFPFIPFVQHWSNPPRKIGFTVVIESVDDSTTLDLYKLRIELPDGKVIRPVAVYTVETTGTWYRIHVDRATTGYKGRLLESGNVVLSRERMEYKLQFDQFPADIEEIIVNLGSVQIINKEVLLPALKYRKSTKYHYYWINDV